MKNAIVIFSAEGNTRHVSEELSKILGGPIFEIKPTIPIAMKTSIGMTAIAAQASRCRMSIAARKYPRLT